MATHTKEETITAALDLIAAEINNRSTSLDLILVDASDESLCDFVIEWNDGRTEPVFSITSQLSEGSW